MRRSCTGAYRPDIRPSHEKEGSPWAHTHCGMSFSYTEDSSTAPVGRASTNRSAATASESASCRTRPCHCRATSRPPSRSSTPRTGQSCWSATPTAARSSPRPAPHPNVAALVYIAAFAPDKGESVNSLLAGLPTDAPQPPILPPKDGFLFLDRDKFHASFAADLPADLAAFMADSQVPWGVGALGGAATEPAWRTKPSWYLAATDDRMIPPPAQHAMAEKAGATLSEVAASHSVYLSQPEAVAPPHAQAAAGAPAREHPPARLPRPRPHHLYP